MELRQFIYYYKLELFICASLLTALIIVTAYSYVKSKLLDKCVEFDDEPKPNPVDEFIKANCDECEHEPVTYRVGITNYATEDGARARCEGLYKRHNINAEVTLFFANESQLKCFALDIWDFNK